MLLAPVSRLRHLDLFEACAVRIETEDHPAPFPDRFKFAITSLRMNGLLAEDGGTCFKCILKDDMRSNEKLWLRRNPPASGVRRLPTCDEVDRIGIRAVCFQLECLSAAWRVNCPSPDDGVLRRVRRCARQTS